MGVKIIELLEPKEITLEELSSKTIIIDAPNHLYQFLTTIRSPDGSAFTDSKGNVTSHLIGLFSRTTNLMERKLKLAFAFDGAFPALKRKELEKRREMKEQAEQQYRQAVEADDTEQMKKYAGRFSRLTPEMTAEAKKLIRLMGLPCVEAASEAEAQASYITRKGEAYGVSSQDADALLFGTPRLIRNLSISGKRKMPGKLNYSSVHPELISLRETLEKLEVTQQQLIAIGMLIGTDYNTKGIKGIGPKKALSMVKRHGSNLEALFEEAKWKEHFEQGWREVYELLSNPAVSKDYELKWSPIDAEGVTRFLCGEHDFSEERVQKSLEPLTAKAAQKGLGEFLK